MKVHSEGHPMSTNRALSILQKGGVIVFPTDTAYGLGAAVHNEVAIEKVFSLKGRSYTNPLPIIVSDLSMAQRYGVFSKRALQIARAFLPGPLTIVVPKTKSIPDTVTAGKDSVGIRIPDTAFVLRLVTLLGEPITATSANKSGTSSFFTLKDVQKSFGKNWEDIDLAIDAGHLGSQVSTIVDMTANDPVILREGPISREEILKVLG